jgi:glycosyltransferase involved in cell wall biosynthesis
VRFALISTTPHNVLQGSGTFVSSVTLARTLEQQGHTVRTIAPQRPPGIAGHTLQRYVFNISLSPDLVAGADAVLGLDMDGFTLAGRVQPFVSYIQGVLADEAGFERGLVAWLLGLQADAERRCAQKADLVITTSNYSRARIAELYGLDERRIGIVPPAFDVARWQSDLVTLAAQPSRSGGPVVFCVAHLYPRKNIAALVRASRILVEAVPDVAVRIAGHGPELADIEQLVLQLGLERTVRLLGQLTHGELLGEFCACDVFCLPSLQEGFGIVYLEAMASGKPVVACRASSTPELIEDGVNGLLASPHSNVDLAEKLTRLVTDTDLRATMGQANREKVQGYAAGVTVERLVDLVTRL